MGKTSQTALTLLAHKKAKRKAKKKSDTSTSPSTEVNEVNTLTSRLTHSDPNFREKALVALVNLNIEQNEKAAQALISPEVLQAILHSLEDPLQNIKLTGLSVIMGLLQTEYVSEVAQFFLQNGLLLSLFKILQEIETQLKAFVEDRSMRPVLDFVSFIRSIAALLENLIQEFQDQALLQIIESEAAEWILRFFLSDSEFLPDVAKACAEFIYAVILQSHKCSPLLCQNIELLEERLSTPHQAYLEMQAYIAGILYHIYQDQGIMEKKMQTVLGPFLSGVFEREIVSEFFLNIEPLVQKYYSKGKKKSGSEETTSTAEEEKFLKQDSEQQKLSEGVIKTWRHAVQATLVMFEILIDLIALPISDEEEPDDGEWQDENAQQLKQGERKGRLPAEIANQILQGDFLEKVYEKFKFKGLTAEIVEKLKGHSSFFDKIFLPILAVRTSAAQTLGNVLLFHQLPSMSQEVASEIWKCVFEIVMLAGQEDVLIVESLLRLLKALLENPPVKEYFKLDAFTNETQLMFLINWLTAQEMRGKVAAVGLLGSILAQKKHTLQENLKVWELLLNLCKTSELELVSQTLNSLFDIYSEDYYDTVLKEQNALQILEQGKKQLAEMIEQSEKEKQYSPLEMSHFRETGLNLERFIDYKRQEMK